MPSHRIRLSADELEIITDSLESTEYCAQEVLWEMVDNEQETWVQELFIGEVRSLLERLKPLMPAEEPADPW